MHIVLCMNIYIRKYIDIYMYYTLLKDKRVDPVSSTRSVHISVILNIIYKGLYFIDLRHGALRTRAASFLPLSR